MTLPIERARSRRPITWLTIIGVILLPVVIGGLLVAALYNPQSRLDQMHAAIVNNDQPVTINGQYVPLGRQLTAGLVKGSDKLDSNLDWTISNTKDAAAGLKDGTYQAVITIPKGFSAAATSTTGTSPEQATIRVTTSPDALIVDEAITSQVTQTAASVMGTTLTETYLDKVFLGFTTLGDNLGTAASGASQLADGAHQAADGSAKLPSGATSLASGASQLGSGASQLQSGANALGSGLDSIASHTKDASGGAAQIAGALTEISGKVSSATGAGEATVGYAKTTTKDATALAESIGGMLQTSCATPAPADPALCKSLSDALVQAKQVATDAGTTQYVATQTSTGIDQLTTGASGGLTTIAGKTNDLAGGLSALAAGTTQSADGARKLGSGAGGIASGADQLSSGATQLASGAQSLSDGVTQLAGGVTSLADGLDKAATSVPRYTDDQAKDLATVVATPVVAKGTGTSLFGTSAIPLLATLALWFGALGSYIAVQAVSRRALTSRRPSALIALRSYGPGAAIGAVQGLLVAGVVQIAASYDWGTWSLFAAVCVIAGVAFAAVNQALVAVFGGAGRWISALVGALVVATGIVSTVPPVLSTIAGILPTSPAYTAMLGVLGTSGGVGGAIVGLIVWAGLSFIATIIAVTRRRTVSARQVLTAQVV
ncbi:YhgE/Pip domain-containing protein [Microbacterium sp. ASV49]|uniref:YhgE/Pip domain-containing protein n=1 Tax=Microbacterium candidum TaxID=3041922 RepID=A0ABT7N4H6_9MICO|nr:YhgE/Pip domain-containing protein [Microbacterium sp. ASV49]MDL9981612.1 YhgE/Pip domain-containing protein [Microbacterium sp. ASV49]